MTGLPLLAKFLSPHR